MTQQDITRVYILSKKQNKKLGLSSDKSYWLIMPGMIDGGNTVKVVNIIGEIVRTLSVPETFAL